MRGATVERKRAVGVGAMVAAIVILAAACGGSSGAEADSSDTVVTGVTAAATGTPGDTGVGGDTEAAAPGGTADLESRLAALTGIPEFVPPGPAFDPSPAQGKHVFHIPAASNIPPIQLTDRVLGELANELGVEMTQWRNQGQKSQWIQGMNQAIAQGADVITLEGINPELLAPQVQEATEAGIAVIPLHIGGEDTVFDPPVAAAVPGPFELAGEAMAAYSIVKSEAEGNVLVITSNDFFPASQLVTESIKTAFSENCPSCTVNYEDVPSAEWATRLQTTVSTAINRDPDIDFIVPIFDGMVQFAVAALDASGQTGEIGVVSYNGTPSVLDQIAEGKVSADVGENDAWLAYADMDQILRVLSGVEPVKTEMTPVRLWTTDNIAEAGSPAELDVGYGDAYVSGYRQLWGLE